MTLPAWGNTDWTENGSNLPTWDVDGVTPIFMCGNGSYGDQQYIPNGGWEVGFVPQSVTIDVTFDAWALANLSNLYTQFYIGGVGWGVSVNLTTVSFPLQIDLTGQVLSDITEMWFNDIHGQYFDNGDFYDWCAAITEVTFSLGTCAQFWTNHLKQYERE